MTTLHDRATRTCPVRLVVVDDDDGIRTLLKVTTSLDPRYELAGMGSCGEEARRAIESALPQLDVVLLDVTLPDVDGIELLRELRPEIPYVRIALFTGWTDDRTLKRARLAGADAVFSKDGDPKRLLDSIAQLVDAA